MFGIYILCCPVNIFMTERRILRLKLQVLPTHT